MSIDYSLALKNTRMQAVVSAIGAGGKLVIGTSSLNGAAAGVLATANLPNPAATVANGVMTFAGTPITTTAAATGTAAKAEVRNSAGDVLVSGLTVGTAGTDVIINATAISVGQSIQLTVGTFTHS